MDDIVELRRRLHEQAIIDLPTGAKDERREASVGQKAYGVI